MAELDLRGTPDTIFPIALASLANGLFVVTLTNVSNRKRGEDWLAPQIATKHTLKMTFCASLSADHVCKMSDQETYRQL